MAKPTAMHGPREEHATLVNVSWVAPVGRGGDLVDHAEPFHHSAIAP